MLLRDLLIEAKWIDTVHERWKPPVGFFTQSADKIAAGLKRAHGDLRSAMSSLSYYINRAGSNLSSEDASRLEAAKNKLRALYNRP